MRSYFESNLNRILDSLDQLKESSEKIGDDAVPSIEDVKKKLHTDNTNALADIIKQIESLELCEKPENESATPINSEFEGQIKNLLKEADELRKSLEQTQKELSRIKKSDEDKASSYKKDLEEKEKKFGKKQLELDELKKKLERLEKDASKDKGSHKELQEKLSSRSSEIEELKKKLKTSDQLNATEAAKIQQHETKIKSLEADLKSARIQLEKRAQVDDSIGDQATKHADEIRTLKESNSNEKKDKEKLTKEVQQLKKEIEKHAEMVSQFDILKDKIKLLGAENASLRRNIEDLENQLQNIEHHASASRNMNEDLSKLQQSETERDQKLQVLEMELRKAHFHNEKLEEKIAMDRKLLSIRHSIIESLQTKESTQKNHMETLFAEVGERNNDLLRLKTELLTKTEDFHKLFSTLSAKQIELTRQEHIIKLLKENNERTQTLRVKQEAKIGQLEEQIDHLKQTISIYQDAVLPNNTLKKNLLMIDANHDCDVTDNLEYYIDERRRKRHIDINVKKYEK